MKHALGAIAMLVAGCASAADVQIITCDFQLEYEYWADLRPQLVKTCSDYGTLMEACTSFSFRSRDRKHGYTATSAGIRSSGAVLDFKPVSLQSYDEQTRDGLARRWLLYFVDNSGGARAEERFAVVDGAFKPLTRLMSYAEKEKYLAALGRRRALATQVGDEPMTCKAAPARK